MKVRDLMSRDVARLPPTATVREAIELMESRRISSVLVERAQEEEPYGIVTRSDIVYRVVGRGLDPGTVRLVEVMSLALIVADPALDVGYANRLMRRFKIRHLPVLDGLVVVGVISSHDVLRVFTLLINVPFFHQLSIDDLMALLQIAAIEVCPAGRTLIEEGSAGGDLFVLDEGEMAVSTRQAGRIARVRAGEFFGEMELFGGRRSATVRAVRDSRLLVFNGERFLGLLAQRGHLSNVVYASIARLLSERLRRANRFLFLRGIWVHRLFMLRVGVIAAAILISLVLGTAAVSENPAFCKSCHYMRPYQQSWSVSTHSKVTCTNCHKSYGLEGALHGKITGVAMVVRYATKTYDPKPEAKISDSSCLKSGCHSPATQAWVFRTPGPDSGQSKEVWFDHKRHLSQLGGVGQLRCTSCHNHREQEEHFSVSASTCFLCHMSKAVTSVTPCLGCHEMRASHGAGKRLRFEHGRLNRNADCLACHGNVSTGSGLVEKSRCFACHLEPDSLSTTEMHRVHVQDDGVDCFDCHATIDHPGPEGSILAGRCETCHAGEHNAQEQLYLGEGGAGVSGRPALMFYMHVECTACHVGSAQGADSTHSGRAGTAAGRACLDCHDASAVELARAWKAKIAALLVRVRAGLTRFEGATDSVSGPTRYPEAFALYREARQNYEMVVADPSAAIHNFRYAEDLLLASEQRLATALALLRAGAGGKE